jgi:tetratricopeptide (TPR) repeat protein
MIKLPLRMRYGEKPLRQAAAWLIPGAAPRIWLDEMLAWGVPLGEAACYPIPRSARDRSPQGVLVVLPPGLAPRATRRSQAYAAVGVPPATDTSPMRQRGNDAGSSLTLRVSMDSASPSHVAYLPVEARIDPDASDAEVAELAADGGDCILHPTVGCIRLEAGDRRRVVDLLAPPPQRSARWDLAEPGQRVNSRLTAIVPAELPTLEQMLDLGRDDIGSESPTLDELPPEPGEPSSGVLGQLGRGLQRKLAQLAQRLFKLSKGVEPPPGRAGQGSAGRRPAKPGLFSKMADWAQRKMAQIDDSIRKSRHRELHRLMHLLEHDPDQGLRFALPCNEGKHRGIAPPARTLASRNVNFDLRRLGGGGRADPWELPGDLYARLRAKYMELAGREMRLGRYRRAAYVYAHLLGDLTNAAAALIAGKHWREAAVLYRDKLKRPEQAAKCLEQGGLWAEAIEFYEQLGDFEKVGDLHARLEQPEEAEKAWRRAVERQLGRRDSLAAAKLLETKLKAPDEALAVLAAAWPGSSQAGHCLAAEFALLGRLGRHEAAQRRVAEIRQQPLSEAVRTRAIDVLVQNAIGFPHEAVRLTAADATRMIAARHLREATGPELDHLLDALRRLVPGDRLLERDTARYLRNRTQPLRPAVKAPAVRTVVPKPHVAMELKRLESIALPSAVRWQCAVSCAYHFHAAGTDREYQLHVVLGSWDGTLAWRCQPTPGQMTGNAHSVKILLACDPRGREPAVLHVCGRPPVAMISFAASKNVPSQFQVGSPGWLPDEAVAVALSANGTKHVLATTDDGLVLNTLDANANPVKSRLITYESLRREGVSDPPVMPVPMCVRDSCVYMGLSNRLVLVAGDLGPRADGMPGIVRSLCGPTPYSVGRIIATLEQGAALYWEEGRDVVPFAEELSHPVAAFTASGWIVLAASEALHVYKTEGRKIQLAVRQGRNVRPVAVLATAHPDGFAVLREDGVVEQYQMPPR